MWVSTDNKNTTPLQTYVFENERGEGGEGEGGEGGDS